MNTPRLTLVGAGTGDPELITIKGIKALQSADVVLYDALVSTELLAYAPRAEHIFTGKRGGIPSLSQEMLNSLIVEYAWQYGHVVRLKGGDPFVFGRGYEEVEHARKHHITTDVIPGISSALAAPALSGIPLTHRGISESFWVVTGTTRHGSLSADLELAARSSATVVILMGMHQLRAIVDLYQQLGKADIPAAIVQEASMPGQRLVLGTIGDIEETVHEYGICAPAVIVVGAVADLAASHYFNNPVLQENYPLQA
jgi:uroporphyrin-III C-methyltransferase